MHRTTAAIALTLLAAHPAANAFTPFAPTESQCAAIFKAAGDKYAGMWLGKDGKLVLGLTSPVELDREIQQMLHIVYVQYSTAELRSFYNQVVIKKFNNNQYIAGSQIDYKINRIVITVRKDNLSKAISIFEDQGIDVKMVHFEAQHTTVTFMPLMDDGSCKGSL
ncbi:MULTISPECIES: hypothetical protein [Comamonas]|uniref:hypothetical protein n=1 Tax=Comamonas TaxID=283 RepID=UPI0015FC2734|nr:hypothetical protein [Comamonas koreensis]